MMFKTRLRYLWLGEKKLDLLLAGLFYIGVITGALADLWKIVLLLLFQVVGIIWQLTLCPVITTYQVFNLGGAAWRRDLRITAAPVAALNLAFSAVILSRESHPLAWILALVTVVLAAVILLSPTSTLRHYAEWLSQGAEGDSEEAQRSSRVSSVWMPFIRWAFGIFALTWAILFIWLGGLWISFSFFSLESTAGFVGLVGSGVVMVALDSWQIRTGFREWLALGLPRFAWMRLLVCAALVQILPAAVFVWLLQRVAPGMVSHPVALIVVIGLLAPVVAVMASPLNEWKSTLLLLCVGIGIGAAIYFLNSTTIIGISLLMVGVLLILAWILIRRAEPQQGAVERFLGLSS
ncbi:hypothetical protein A4R63_10195 [Corynebacterium pseudotuberculosis]|nr:hypothetical protein CP31_10630 [Corynebacterium pseudotuberculosis 31]APB11789.1 hypothetical protein A4R72_10430 [Corynebacterium pseudotuberculosis]APB13832.1 hypothetical protein A4R71_10445 [Corynebacterium pseudotuberculosis]APB15874.1 hypothetical protein A4R68_10445 [Corynebacterium pseudotuberculosis]APB17919.1 hypothetical protein A4R67_10420 [Corynebacterium pseudotuberculosis]